MPNPLYPNSSSTGVMGEYEKASWLDDTAEEMARRKDDRIQRGLDTIDFEPRQSTAKTTNLDTLEIREDTLEIREEPKSAEKVQKKASKATSAGAGLAIGLIIALFIVNPLVGILSIFALGALRKH